MYMRSLVGPEDLLYKFYDDPTLIHDCMKTWFELADAVIAIEWAEKLPKDTLSNHLQLRFEITGESARRIDLFAYGHPAANLLKALETEFRGMIGT